VFVSEADIALEAAAALFRAGHDFSARRFDAIILKSLYYF
jgi:hypothetical protein